MHLTFPDSVMKIDYYGPYGHEEVYLQCYLYSYWTPTILLVAYRASDIDDQGNKQG